MTPSLFYDVEGRAEMLWATAMFPENVSGRSETLFTVPLGKAGNGFTSSLTLSQTNLKESRRWPLLDKPFHVGVVEVRVSLVGLSRGSQTDVIRHGRLEWDFFTERNFPIAPLAHFNWRANTAAFIVPDPIILVPAVSQFAVHLHFDRLTPPLSVPRAERWSFHVLLAGRRIAPTRNPQE